MREELLAMLECPYDHFHPLEVVRFEEDEGEIKEGLLYCRKCYHWYPIQEFVASIMPDELRHAGERQIMEAHRNEVPKQILENGQPFNLFQPNIESLAKSEDPSQKSEMETRDAQAINYSDLAKRLRGPAEVSSVKRRLRPSRGDIILDLGCGVGRLTGEVANHCRKTVCADFSHQSLKVLRANCKAWHIDNYFSVQCDASLSPFRDSLFDKVLLADVLQHLPSDNLRRRTLQGICRVMKENGLFVIDVYNYTIFKRLQKKQIYTKSDIHPGNDGKTGYHSNNAIYYYNFDFKELKELLGEYFKVEELCGILIRIPLVTRLLRYIISVVNADSLLQKTPLAKYFGVLLLAKCRKVNHGGI
jgi:ubiquinone/menaquinone biosynthesis C-methylase UbiE/uncharacterized protein YbaR (Trm112 family)